MEHTDLLLYKLNKYQKKLEHYPNIVIYQRKYAYYNDLIGGGGYSYKSNIININKLISKINYMIDVEILQKKIVSGRKKNILSFEKIDETIIELKALFIQLNKYGKHHLLEKHQIIPDLEGEVKKVIDGKVVKKYREVKEVTSMKGFNGNLITICNRLNNNIFTLKSKDTKHNIKDLIETLLKLFNVYGLEIQKTIDDPGTVCSNIFIIKDNIIQLK